MFARAVPACGSAMHARRRHHAVGLGLAVLLAQAQFGIAVASPSLEYGPEAEARFVERCMSTLSAKPGRADCQRLMERIQGEHGYAAFMEAAAGGPAAFGVQSVDFSAQTRTAEVQLADEVSR